MFNKDYWRSSAEKLSNVRYLALIAAFVAMKTIVSGFYIPVGENLRIGLSFLFTSVEAAIIGPVAAVVSGFVTDILGFMLFPSGPFFFGYTISSMAGGLVYALFLYRKRITVLRLAGAKLIVNMFVNVVMGSIWSAMLYSKGYLYYLAKSLTKNTMMLPIEVILMTAVFNIMIPILTSRKLIVAQDKLPIHLK